MNEKPGIGGEDFKIMLDRDWFAPGDSFQVTVDGKPRPVFKHFFHRLGFCLTLGFFFQPIGYEYKIKDDITPYETDNSSTGNIHTDPSDSNQEDDLLHNDQTESEKRD